MNIAFAGTPEFAEHALRALHGAGHEISLVWTKPDQPGRRGMKLLPSAVKSAALDLGLRVRQPRSLRLEGKYPEDAKAARQDLQESGARALVVAAYGLILPAWTLQATELGAINIHGSLLPRWRGAAPVQRAIMEGDAQTGVSIMLMDEGLDTGAVLSMRAIDIKGSHTGATLMDDLAALGSQMILESLLDMEAGRSIATAQTEEGMSYAKKIEKSERQIDWSQSSTELSRKARALDPTPGMSFPRLGEDVKIWGTWAKAEPSVGAPGTILGMDGAAAEIACGSGRIFIEQMQRPGGKRQPAAEVLRGLRLGAGALLAGASSAPKANAPD